MTAIDRITTSPDVCGGRPCIRGLRIRVKDVLDLLAAGATRDEILEDYPYLEPAELLRRVEAELSLVVAALERGETLVEIA
jgi:uncharacterized protein (DUF433 family)